MTIEVATTEVLDTLYGRRYARLIGYLGGRKFIAVMSTLITATWLVYTQVIEPVIYRDIMIGVVAAYVVSNVWQKRVEATNSASQ